MFEHYWQQQQRKKLFGLLDESLPVNEAGMLNDPETSAFPVADEPQPLRTEGFQKFLQTQETPVPQTPMPAPQQPVPPTPDPAQVAFPVAPEPTQPVQPVQPATPYPVSQADMTQERINAIGNKDYSIKKNQPLLNAQGEVVGTYDQRGKDRDKKWSTLEKIGNAAQGFLMGLAKGGLGGGIAEGVRGATNRNYNEKLDDRRELQTLYPRLAQEQQAETYGRQRELQNANIALAQQKPAIESRKLSQKDTQIAMRQSQQEFQKANAEQKTALSTIMKRGYYREGVNAEEDARLAALDIVLPDFDSRKRDVREQAGKFYQRNPDTNQWEETNMPTDESEVPIDFVIGGKQMKLRPRDIANIEASKERQTSAQTFTAEENEKKRAFELQKQKIGNDMRLTLETLKNINTSMQKETDATRRQILQQQQIEAQKEYIRLRAEAKQMEQ